MKILCWFGWHKPKEIKRDGCVNVGWCQRCGGLVKMIGYAPIQYTLPKKILMVGSEFKTVTDAMDAAEPYQNIYIECGKW